MTTRSSLLDESKLIFVFDVHDKVDRRAIGQRDLFSDVLCGGLCPAYLVASSAPF
jgi:hypothetical protein